MNLDFGCKKTDGRISGLFQENQFEPLCSFTISPADRQGFHQGGFILWPEMECLSATFDVFNLELSVLELEGYRSEVDNVAILKAA